MKIDILICTYNSGINNVPNIILPESENVSYKISHQVTDSKFSCIPDSLVRNDIKISQISTKGLSTNRNNVLQLADGDICLIADDDVRYDLKSLMTVIEIFEENHDIDVLTGKIKTFAYEPEYKKYAPTKHKVSWFNVGSVSSIEIAFRRSAIFSNKIKFDSRFGLSGEIFSKGEEVIFLTDCLKKRLKIVYFPIYIVTHHYQSSGKCNTYDKNEIYYWGGLSQRIFGPLAYALIIVLCIKHYKRYKNNMSPLSYVKFFIKGTKLLDVK